MINLIELEKKIDEALGKETPKSLRKWIMEKRKQENGTITIGDNTYTPKKRTHVTAKKFVLEQCKHLRKFYGTDKEFKDHLMSGEVKMPIPDVIEMIVKFHNQ